MKVVCIHIAGILLFSLDLYSQDDQAVQFEGTTRFDMIGVRNHDNRKYALFHGEADIAVSILSENLKLFKGGEFYIQAMGIFGNKASGDYTGDLQVFSNIENHSRIFLYQCWYKQTINKFIIKLGQLDMNSDYSVSSWASPMINSSFGIIPTISLNMPVSIFAYLSAGVSLKYMANDRLTLQTAFFDGDPGNFDSNRHNLNWQFRKEEGWFNISELHYKPKSNLMQGKYKLGIFYHSRKFSDPFDIESQKGNAGVFLMGDQQLTAEKNTIKNGLSMFFQVSVTPARVNIVKSYFSMGLIYRGMFPGMNEDEFTLAFASARLGDNYLKYTADLYDNETALEITYKKYITPGIIIQPDIQYIIHPGANRLLGNNVTIGLIRTIIAF